MLYKLIQLGLYFGLLSLTLIKSINNPARAQSVSGNNYPSQVNSVLPRNTSMLITVLHPISIDVKSQETLPTVAILSAPLYNRHGRQLIPQGVPVTITLKPSSAKTGQVYASSIIWGSVTIPIKASSEEIRGRKITLAKNSQRMSRTVQLGQDVGSLLGYALNPFPEERAEQVSQYYALGGLVGGLVDLAAGEESLRIVGLRAGHTLTLKLEEDAPLYLPKEYPQQLPAGFNNPSSFTEALPTVQALNSSSGSILASTQREQFTRNPVYLETVNQPLNSSPSAVAAKGSIHRLNGQPVSPAILTRLRSLLAKNYLVEVDCGTIPQQVTIRVNNEFVLCGYPNTKYRPGDYSLTVNEL